MQKGYKVLLYNLANGKYFSSSILYGAVEYCKDKPAVPKAGCGPLCLFKTEKSAMQYIKYLKDCMSDSVSKGHYIDDIFYMGYVLFEVNYKPSKSKRVWYINPCYPACPKFETSVEDMIMPSGMDKTDVVLADSVTLGERIA